MEAAPPRSSDPACFVTALDFSPQIHPQLHMQGSILVKFT